MYNRAQGGTKQHKDFLTAVLMKSLNITNTNNCRMSVVKCHLMYSLLFKIYITQVGDRGRAAQCCATNQKVAGSISVGVN